MSLIKLLGKQKLYHMGARGIVNELEEYKEMMKEKKILCVRERERVCVREREKEREREREADQIITQTETISDGNEEGL